ncbi:MAG: hypothetical protein M3Z64_01860 [Verrucomicrobiota bacterium]|nr:hypothetical protein [Verrucomicrobiota bacterium]
MFKGEKAAAQPLYEQAAREFQSLRDKGDESLFLADNLIQVTARLGRRDEVARQANALIEQTSKDQWRFPRTKEVLARTYLVLGDIDRALPLVEQALSMQGETSLTAATLRLDPTWDAVRSDPRFVKLVSEQHR